MPIPLPTPLAEYLSLQVNNIADTMMNKLAFRSDDVVEVYRELINDDEVFKLFMAAMPHLDITRSSNYIYTQWRGCTVRLMFTGTPQVPVLLLPAKGFKFTPESNIGKQLEELRQVAIDWVSTITLFHHLSSYDARVIGATFPWIKNILLDSAWFHGERAIFIEQHSLKSISVKALDIIFAQLIEGKPRQYPTFTPRVNAICKASIRLFAQYQILKNVPNDAAPIRAVIRLEDCLVPSFLADELCQIGIQWNSEMLHK